MRKKLCLSFFAVIVTLLLASNVMAECKEGFSEVFIENNGGQIKTSCVPYKALAYIGTGSNVVNPAADGACPCWDVDLMTQLYNGLADWLDLHEDDYTRCYYSNWETNWNICTNNGPGGGTACSTDYGLRLVNEYSGSFCSTKTEGYPPERVYDLTSNEIYACASLLLTSSLWAECEVMVTP